MFQLRKTTQLCLPPNKIQLPEGYAVVHNGQILRQNPLVFVRSLIESPIDLCSRAMQLLKLAAIFLCSSYLSLQVAP